MEKDNLFADDITFNKPSSKKIDDFASLKDNTMDFLSHERAEKVDVEKPKSDVDDFLNFHDDFGESKPPKENPVLIPSIEKNEEKTTQPEPEIDFHAVEDEYLNPYGSANLTHNEKFISSEDLLTDFKDPIPAPAEVKAPPKPVVLEKQPPPVTEPVKPVEAPQKPKNPPPPAPVKQSTSDGTQIEAEKIFKSIGLG